MTTPNNFCARSLATLHMIYLQFLFIRSVRNEDPWLEIVRTYKEIKTTRKWKKNQKFYSIWQWKDSQIQVLKLIYKRHKHCETKVAERWDSNWYGVFPIDLTDRGISILLSITITLWRKLTSEVIVSMKLAGFSSNFVRLNEDNHARSQEFLRVFVLRT